MSKYEVYINAIGQWQWRLKAGNGEIVAGGEGYKRRAGALQGVTAHRRAAKTEKVVMLG